MLDLFEEYNPKKEIENIKKFSPIEFVEYFQNSLISRATGGGFHPEVYKYVRQVFLQSKLFEDYIPSWIKTNRTPDDFWQFIKPMYDSYQERRIFIRNEFAPLLDFLESKTTTPIEKQLQFDELFIQLQWEKALDRIQSDPEAAITSARTLLESTLKYILDSIGIEYQREADLPDLYRVTTKALNLAPEQHQEQIFKQILTGSFSVVQGLGTLRNKLGDAHGKSMSNIKPSPRHSEFAVNLAGATAMFLYRTFKETKNKKEKIE